MVHDIKQKIVCSGNPDGHPDDHTWQHTVAHGVREYLPDTKFVHSTNGYDLRLWDDQRRNSFVDLIKDSTVFIILARIILVVIESFDLLIPNFYTQSKLMRVTRLSCVLATVKIIL